VWIQTHCCFFCSGLVKAEGQQHWFGILRVCIMSRATCFWLWSGMSSSLCTSTMKYYTLVCSRQRSTFKHFFLHQPRCLCSWLLLCAECNTASVGAALPPCCLRPCRHQRRLVCLRLRRIGLGAWQSDGTSKRLRTAEPGLELYRTKITRGGRIIWQMCLRMCLYVQLRSFSCMCSVCMVHCGPATHAN
jgi:hypothetical protein